MKMPGRCVAYFTMVSAEYEPGSFALNKNAFIHSLTIKNKKPGQQKFS
jgi:hypothetical protein